MTRQRYAVIGGGIVGLAIARALALDGRADEVTLLEKESELGRHQTGRNSGVVHAGLYYTPGSDKARLSRRGVEMLRGYCADHDVPFVECGKVLVALDDAEVSRMRDIHERARANGVPGVRWLTAEGIREIEPHVSGVAGLHSPTSATVDFRLVAGAYADDAVAAGATVRTGAEVIDIAPGSPNRLTTASGEVLEAERVVVAAGLFTDRLARLAGDSLYPRIVPFRGDYLALRESARDLVRGLVYPVPDPRYPFLGVHLTTRVDGSVLIGPNAVLALAREGYRVTDVERAELAELLRFRGFRSFARDNVRAGARELWGSLNRRSFVAAARRYVPDLSMADVEGAEPGVRAQAMDEGGCLVEDFRFSRVGSIFCVRNAPSPAATASLAIAEMVLERMHAHAG